MAAFCDALSGPPSQVLKELKVRCMLKDHKLMADSTALNDARVIIGI